MRCVISKTTNLRLPRSHRSGGLRSHFSTHLVGGKPLGAESGDRKLGAQLPPEPCRMCRLGPFWGGFAQRKQSIGPVGEGLIRWLTALRSQFVTLAKSDLRPLEVTVCDFKLGRLAAGSV